MAVVVCGIDPGLGATGYAVLRRAGERLVVIDAGVCRLDARLPIAERLARLEEDITSVLTEHQPDLVAVEAVYAHYKHPRTAIMMGHARGVILLVAAKLGMEVRSYAATRIKRYLTGNGRAAKTQVQRAVQNALSLSDPPEPPDVADALAIAICCMGDAANKRRVELVG